MVKVLAFCMWGNIKTYCIGCIKNVILAKHLFPNWEVWIYYNSSVPQCVIRWLKQRDNVKLFEIDDEKTASSFQQNGQQGSIWRYYPLSDKNVEVVVCRDIDSRLSYYEVVQIDRWLKEDRKDVLSMIDDYERKAGKVVRAGTCAFRVRNREIDIIKEVKNVFYTKETLPFYCDETFLHYLLKKYYVDSIKFIPRGVRDKLEPAPSCDLFTVFVGDVLDENNQKVDKYRNHVWQRRRLKDDDDGEIQKCISSDEEKIVNFVKRNHIKFI